VGEAQQAVVSKLPPIPTVVKQAASNVQSVVAESAPVVKQIVGEAQQAIVEKLPAVPSVVRQTATNVQHVVAESVPVVKQIVGETQQAVADKLSSVQQVASSVQHAAVELPNKAISAAAELPNKAIKAAVELPAKAISTAVELPSKAISAATELPAKVAGGAQYAIAATPTLAAKVQHYVTNADVRTGLQRAVHDAVQRFSEISIVRMHNDCVHWTASQISKHLNIDEEIARKVIIISEVTAVGVAVVHFVVPALFDAAGFTTAGIGKHTVGSYIQSVVYGGSTRGIFSHLQSAGARGFFAHSSKVMLFYPALFSSKL
jgi:hypothetical protein